MAVNRYIGMRYVPKIIGQHDPQIAYEALSIVTYNGNSYTSKQNVPPGTEITNTDYWVVTGNYNAQVEQYRSEVVNAVATVTEGMSNLESSVNQTVEELEGNVAEAISDMQSDVTSEMEATVTTVNNSLATTTASLQSRMDTLSTNVNADLAETTTEIEGYVDDRVATALPNVYYAIDDERFDASERSTLKTYICRPAITIDTTNERAYATINIPLTEVSGHQYFIRSACINWYSPTQGSPTIGPKDFVVTKAAFTTIGGISMYQIVMDAMNYVSETTNITYRACIDYIDIAPAS